MCFVLGTDFSDFSVICVSAFAGFTGFADSPGSPDRDSGSLVFRDPKDSWFSGLSGYTYIRNSNESDKTSFKLGLDYVVKDPLKKL